MSVDDDLGDIVSPDIRWASRPAGPPTGAAPPPGEGADAEQQATSSSRRRRAFSLIAISVIALSVAGLAYLSPTWTAKPATPPLKAAPTPASNPTVIGLNTETFGPQRWPPLSETYASNLMRYSVNYPTGWDITPATQTWHGEWGNWGQPDIDHLDGNHVAFWGTSQPLGPGQSATKWTNRYLVAVGGNKCGVQERVSVAGHVGVIDLNGCTSSELPGRVYDVVIVAGRRGYNFSMEGVVDRAFFLAMLATVKLS